MNTKEFVRGCLEIEKEILRKMNVERVDVDDPNYVACFSRMDAFALVLTVIEENEK